MLYGYFDIQILLTVTFYFLILQVIIYHHISHLYAYINNARIIEKLLNKFTYICNMNNFIKPANPDANY